MLSLLLRPSNTLCRNDFDSYRNTWLEFAGIQVEPPFNTFVLFKSTKKMFAQGTNPMGHHRHHQVETNTLVYIITLYVPSHSLYLIVYMYIERLDHCPGYSYNYERCVYIVPVVFSTTKGSHEMHTTHRVSRVFYVNDQ